MKNATPLIIAALAAGAVFLYVRGGGRLPFRDTLRSEPRALPSPNAFTEAPIYASDVRDSSIFT